MKQFRTKAVAALALGLLIAAPSAWSVTRAAAPKAPDDVVVQNTAANPVPTTIVGTPSVSVAGTPSVSIAGTPSVALAGTPSVAIAGTPTVKVAQAPQPFQAFVAFSASGAGQSCSDPISVPSGMQLALQSVIAEGLTGATLPTVYLGVTTSTGSGGSFLETVPVEMHTIGVRSGGSVQTLLFVGSGMQGTGETVFAALCSQGASGTIRGFLTGYLTPAS